MDITRLKDIREDRDLLQADIAKYLGIKQQQYSRYELGDFPIPVKYLEKLADYYHTSVDYLLGRTDVREPYPKSIL